MLAPANRQTSSRQQWCSWHRTTSCFGAIRRYKLAEATVAISRAWLWRSLPRAVATSHTCCFAVGDGWRRRSTAPDRLDCHPPCRGKKQFIQSAIVPILGQRPTVQTRRRSPFLDNDERWLGDGTNYGRSRFCSRPRSYPTQHFFDFSLDRASGTFRFLL